MQPMPGSEDDESSCGGLTSFGDVAIDGAFIVLG